MRALAPILLVVLVAAPLASCAGARKSSRLTSADLDHSATELAAKLSSSEPLAGRTADSARWTIAIDRVENLSSDVVTQSERWWLVYRVRDAEAMRTLRQTRNVVWVIPSEQLAMLRESGYDARDAASERAPTHTMSGTIRSATRNASPDRTDVYRVEFAITDLSTGALVWSDGVEFKRAAVGRAWD